MGARSQVEGVLGDQIGWRQSSLPLLASKHDMKHLLLKTIAAVVLVVGCGESQQSAPSPETKPIHDAAQKEDIEAVKQHLAAGTDVNVMDVDEWTPLHYAAHEGHKEVAELLIAKGADVNAKASGGRTPLHRAASLGHKEIAELLIAKGADVNAKEGSGGTPLNEAALWGHNEVANLLRKHGGTAGKELIARPTKQTKSINRQADYNLRMAAFYGRLEEVKQAITDGADVNSKNKQSGETPLHRAAKGKYYEIAKLLVSKGADVNVRSAGDSLFIVGNSTPLHYAVDSESKDMAQAVNEIGRPSTNNDDGAKQITELLLASGADVNAKDEDGDTPLDLADIETADLLRKHGGKTGEELKAEGK